MLPAESVEVAVARRVERLTCKDGKSELELEELRFLISQHVRLMAQKNKHAERMEEIRAMVNTGVVVNDGRQGGSEEGNDEGGKKRKRPRKNDVGGLTKEIFDEKANGHLFEYQQYVREHGDELFRFILKGRQEGFTYYFAWEGFEKAVLTGKNQIFFSASKPQRKFSVSIFSVLRSNSLVSSLKATRFASAMVRYCVFWRPIPIRRSPTVATCTGMRSSGYRNLPACMKWRQRWRRMTNSVLPFFNPQR